MSVTAVIPHWNRRDLLLTLLTNLREQTRTFGEIIVADNGSSDDSIQVAESAGARVVRLGSNLGFAAAVNRGMKESAFFTGKMALSRVSISLVAVRRGL